MSDGTNPNAEHIDFWAGAQGDKWVRLQRRIDAMLGPFGEQAMARLHVARGDHVLDIGCGCGDTSFALADRAGPDGSVTGVDVSTPMLQQARARAATIPELNLTFLEADAQTQSLPSERFGRLFSRFGVMFFEDARAAFANLLAAARPGASLAFVCWRDRRDNPWATLPARIAKAHVELPPTPPPNAPGQFGFENPDFVSAVLSDAGWSNAALDRFDTRIAVGADPEDAADFLIQMGPAGGALADAEPALRDAVRAKLRDALDEFAEPGRVLMDYSTWIVTAEKP